MTKSTEEKIIKIKSLDHAFIKQLNQLLDRSFPNVVKFSAEYYLGKNSNDKKGLYGEIKSSVLGTIYQKRKQMKEYELVSDLEEDFISDMINDFIIRGILTFNMDAAIDTERKQLSKSVRSKNFRNVMPRMILFPN